MSLDVNISEPDEFNCIELHECIKSVANIKGFQDFVYHVDIICGNGENYIANVFRVIIKEAESENSFSVIVKTLINTSRQELFRELHQREVQAYKIVIDKYIELQEHIALSRRLILPHCVFTSTTKNNEVIVLEDLSERGFEVDKRLVSHDKLSYQHVLLVITELAKFHALSFVYENRVENFEEIRNQFDDLLFKDTFLNKAKLRNYYNDSFQSSLSLVIDADAKCKLEKVMGKLMDLLKVYTEPKKYNVLCHGDCWMNNILFRDQDNKTDLCFLDYQALRYASPVTDILFFIYICTDAEFRSEYFETVKTAYYDNFNVFLEQFNLEGNKVYPQKEFENDMNEMLPFGLLIALVELRIVTTHNDEIISEDSKLYDNFKASKDGSLQTRVNDVVNESISNGVLEELFKLTK